jgi:gliding motility-associated-like protein
MHIFCKHLFLMLLLLAACSRSNAQSACLDVAVNADDTVCAGTCVTLAAQLTGPASTTSYSTLSTSYTPYAFTGGNPVLVNLDDLWSPVINIPFCFSFYGTTYNQLIVGTNGLVSFDVAQANGACPWTISAGIPNPALPRNCIMAPYHDINPMTATAAGNTEINWQVYGTAPCRTFVVSWNDVAQYGPGCDTLSSTSQVVLHESTYIIDIFIANKSLCTGWNNGCAIEGLHNANGTAGTAVPGRNFPSQWTASNDAVRFRPAGLPAATYQWLDPSNTVVSTLPMYVACPAQTSTYTLNVTYTVCSGPPVTVSDQVTIHVIPTVLAATGVSVPPLCLGICNGSATVNVTSGQGPFTYTWAPSLPPQASQTNLCPGQYQCTVTDANGCTTVVQFNLTPQILFNVSTISTPTSCNANNGTATATPTGGTVPYMYLWDTGDTTSSISNLATGSYNVIVTDSLGCTDTLAVFVAAGTLPLTYTNTTLLCFGDSTASATVTTQGGSAPFTYVWGPYGGTSPTATGLTGGNYICMVTDCTGCIGTVTFTITSPPQMIVIPSSNATICFGESTTISAAVSGGVPPYAFSWSHSLSPVSSHLITPTQTDTYTVLVTDGNGCSSPMQTTQVKVTPLPVADFYSLEPGCPPAVVPFYNMTDTAVTYLWNFGDPSSGANNTSSLEDPAHIYVSSGTYNVTLIATNIWGCADTVTHATGAVLAAPSAEIEPAASVITTVDPSTSFINYSSGADSYCIFFGDGDSLCTNDFGPYPHTYDSLGIFTVMLVTWNSLGCTDTAWTQVAVEEPTTCFVPNAFTPNGSGLNDEFMVYGINVDEFELRIYDRWGMLLFTSRDIYDGWDGTFRGSKCQEDVYVWKLTYENNFGEKKMLYGHVSLIR